MMQKQPPEMFYIKKGVLKNFAKFTVKQMCQSLFFFSCEFCEIFKNTFYIEHIWTNASDDHHQLTILN